MTQTVAFAIFPFTHKGYQFISKVAETSRHLSMIINMKDDFIKMNTDAIDELIPMLQDLSIEEVRESLIVLNDGGSEMFLELVGTN